MEDKFTNQEEQLRAIAEDFSLDIDTSELWNKVEAQLPPVEGDRRRPIIWWFASGFLILTIGILVWNISSGIEPKENVEEASILPLNQIANNLKIDTETKHAENSPLTSKPIKTKIALTKPTIEETTKTTKTTQKTAEPAKEDVAAIYNSNRYDEKSESLIDQSSTVNSSVETLIDPAIKMETMVEPENVIQNRTILSQNQLLTLWPKSIEKKSEFDFPTLEIEPLKSSFWLPYFALSSGMNTQMSKVYSNVDEGLDMSQFDNEKPLLGISTDIQYGFENRSGWRVSLGFNHNRIVNRFTQLETITVSENITGNTTSKIDDEGNISHLNGPLIENTVTDYDLNWHRKHDFINVQLSVGKSLFRTQRFAFFADGLIGKNIWSNHSGYYFEEEDVSISKFSAGEDNPYKNAGYNVGLNMSLEYKINEISICLKPFARVGLGSFTQSSNYYQLKNSQYGIQLGVVYRP